jgi:hypothetical protein
MQAKPRPTHVTYTQFQFSGFSDKRWALKQMGILPRLLKKAEGANFVKFLGTGGGNGFSLKPDFGTYALVIGWENAQSQDRFFREHLVFKNLLGKARCYWTAFLLSIRSRGFWNGQQPFATVGFADAEKPICVLTRASISPWKALRFWRSVPKVGRFFEGGANQGMLYAKGIGEWPIFEQATFSVWESAEAMRKFAYQTRAHKEVISKTKNIDWYSEELFAEFLCLKVEGTDPEKPVLPFENIARAA